MDNRPRRDVHATTTGAESRRAAPETYGGEFSSKPGARERGCLTKEARRIAAEHGLSLRQAYRYAASGRKPSEHVRIGRDGRRYHVQLRASPYDFVEARRIRYMVATVAKRAQAHGITEADVVEVERAVQCVAELAATWRACFDSDTEAF